MIILKTLTFASSTSHVGSAKRKEKYLCRDYQFVKEVFNQMFFSRDEKQTEHTHF